jgi:hypothetical protein
MLSILLAASLLLLYALLLLLLTVLLVFELRLVLKLRYGRRAAVIGRGSRADPRTAGPTAFERAANSRADARAQTSPCAASAGSRTGPDACASG